MDARTISRTQFKQLESIKNEVIVLKLRVMIRQDESHTEIELEREIDDPEEAYCFVY